MPASTREFDGVLGRGVECGWRCDGHGEGLGMKFSSLLCVMDLPGLLYRYIWMLRWGWNSGFGFFELAEQYVNSKSWFF